MTSRPRLLSSVLAAAIALGPLSALAKTPACDNAELRALPPGSPKRIEFLLQPREMTFAQNNKLPLIVLRHGIQRIAVSWQSQDRGVLAPFSEPTLRRADDASTFIEVVPPAIGKLRLEVTTVFEDCLFEDSAIDASVPAPAEAPDRFVLAWMNWKYLRKIGVAHMDFSDFSGLVVTPIAFYKESPPAPVLSDDVAFSVIAPKGMQPPIAVDSSSRSVKPLSVGQALIQATFRGKADYICVDVTRDANAASKQSDCRDLLPPGKTVPTEPADIPAIGR